MFQGDNDAENFEKLISSIKESNEVRFFISKITFFGNVLCNYSYTKYSII